MRDTDTGGTDLLKSQHAVVQKMQGDQMGQGLQEEVRFDSSYPLRLSIIGRSRKRKDLRAALPNLVLDSLGCEC